jgi:ATP-dependent Lon protease
MDLTNFDALDIHIHIPAGATPKDGPSAGTAILVALASLFTQRRVRSDLALTGEISLRGRILPVGGVKEKVLAACRARLKQVILPERNRKDWEEVPSEVRHKLKARFVQHVSELIPLALHAQ